MRIKVTGGKGNTLKVRMKGVYTPIHSRIYECLLNRKILVRYERELILLPKWLVSLRMFLHIQAIYYPQTMYIFSFHHYFPIITVNPNAPCY